MPRGTRHDMLAILDRGRGRPTLLNPETHAAIVDKVRVTGKHGPAAASVGVGPTTMSNWIKRAIIYAEKLDAGEDVDDNEEQYLNFAIDVAQAMSEHHNGLLTEMHRLGMEHEVHVEKVTRVEDADGNAKTTTVVERRRAAEPSLLMWLAEKLHPEEYRNLTRFEMTGADGDPIEVDERVVVRNETDDRLVRLFAALADVQRGSDSVPEIESGGPAAGEGDVVDAASYEVHAPHTNGKATGVPPPQ